MGKRGRVLSFSGSDQARARQGVFVNASITAKSFLDKLRVALLVSGAGTNAFRKASRNVAAVEKSKRGRKPLSELAWRLAWQLIGTGIESLPSSSHTQHADGQGVVRSTVEDTKMVVGLPRVIR